MDTTASTAKPSQPVGAMLGHGRGAQGGLVLAEVLAPLLALSTEADASEMRQLPPVR